MLLIEKGSTYNKILITSNSGAKEFWSQTHKLGGGNQDECFNISPAPTFGRRWDGSTYEILSPYFYTVFYRPTPNDWFLRFDSRYSGMIATHTFNWHDLGNGRFFEP